MHPLQALTTASENRNSAIWKVRIKGVARVPQIFSPSCPQDSDYCDVCVKGGGSLGWRGLEWRRWRGAVIRLLPVADRCLEGAAVSPHVLLLYTV